VYSAYGSNGFIDPTAIFVPLHIQLLNNVLDVPILTPRDPFAALEAVCSTVDSEYSVYSEYSEYAINRLYLEAASRESEGGAYRAV
jgi:hypothetical protein